MNTECNAAASQLAAGQLVTDPSTTSQVAPIYPEWPAPAAVHAACSTRSGGVSIGPWAGLNLGRSGGDDTEAVSENRRRFAQAIGLPNEPCWIQQVHGAHVVRWHRAADASMPQADAAFTTETNVVCAVQAADCLPVLLCDQSARVVGAVHAGWRGLAGGVIEATVKAMCESAAIAPNECLAWLGPAIGPAAFEVGVEVRDAFMRVDPAAQFAFKLRSQENPASVATTHDGPVPVPVSVSVPESQHKYWADLFLLAQQALHRAGVQQIWGGGTCTYQNPERFFSYRRDGVTGRMAAMIWLDAHR